MRVLMLTQFYPPYIGGEERHVRNLSRSLAARGHEVSVATLRGADMAPFELDEGVRVHRISGSMQRIEGLFSDSDRRHAPPFPDPELTLALRRIVASERPQIVHGHNWLTRSFLPLKPWSGAKLVLSVHDHSPVCPKKKLIIGDQLCAGPSLGACLSCAGAHYGKVKGAPVVLANRLVGGLERRAVDMFVPVSQAVADDNGLAARGLPVQVIPNFVPDDVAELEPAPHPLTELLPKGDFMLFVGAFGRYKGLDVLLEAYAGLRDAPPLVIIGYQTSEYPIQTKVFPPGVVALYDWPHAAVMQAWARSMLAIVPSTWSEPCPTVAMEAMALGKAVIASRIGGLTDIVGDGETGLLVAPSDPAALREAMAALLADPARRAAMGAAGARRVARFQAGAVISSIEHLYASLVGS